MTIADRIKNVRQDLHDLAHKYHINEHSLKLLAVSKTHPVSAIQAAYEEGVADFGESYIQEAVSKIQSLSHLELCWHFIGPIQSNKTRLIADHFDWVQSVDREKILLRLNQQRSPQKKPLNLCIQLNYFAEPQKKGVSREELPHLLDLASKLPHIMLRGLMLIAPKTDCFETQLSQFKQIKACFDQYRQKYPQMDTLSMGMSGDKEAAIAAGSNMLRIGTDIFGKREQSLEPQELNLNDSMNQI